MRIESNPPPISHRFQKNATEYLINEETVAGGNEGIKDV